MMERQRITIFFYTFCILTSGLLVNSEITPCSSDDTMCDCEQSHGSLYKLSCERIELARVPKLTDSVAELSMFRTPLRQATVGANLLNSAAGLQRVKIESCELTSLQPGAFLNLYSLQTLNLASNNIKTLPKELFRDLNLLQTMDLSDNILESIHEDVFSGLQNLKELDLSFNSLESLSGNLLRHLPSLKTLRLQNSLKSIAVLPNTFLSQAPQLETLNLNENKITQLQPELFENSRSLRELRLRSNSISSIHGEVFYSLSQLTILELADNPFTCNCQLSNYRQWIDSMASRSWAPADTGKCMNPPEFRGQFISNLPLVQFTCSPTTSVIQISTIMSTEFLITEETSGQSPEGRESTTSTTPTSKASSTGDGGMPKALEDVTGEDNSNSLEQSLIIGCSIGGAFLLILFNIMIIFCVRRAKRHTGTRKLKYIVRPDALEENQNADGDYAKIYKQPTVNGIGPSYIISNGVSGFYHTGSRSRLYGTDLDQSLYDVPPKTDNFLDEEKTTLKFHESIFSIAMPQEENNTQADQVEPSANQVYRSCYTPTLLYTETCRTPVPNVQRSVSFKSTTDHWREEQHNIYNVDESYRHDTMTNHEHNYPPLAPDQSYHSLNPYYTSNNYLDIDQCTDDIHSQEFIPGETLNVKYSTGSADSGIHSTSPYQGISASMSPALQHRHTDEHLGSIHEFDPTHNMSINSKKIRNETYV